MTLNSTSFIINQNNHAVSMIEAGNLKEAIKALSASLQSYKRRAQEASSLRRTEEQTNSEEEQRYNFVAVDQYMMTNKSILKNKEEGSYTPFIHRNAIVIVPSSSSKSCYNQQEEEDAIFPIIFFNVALAYHLLAPEFKADTSSGLQKALYFYKLAFKKVQQERKYLDSNFLFVLAILNNMGTIHFQLNKSSFAKHFLDKMLSILMFLLDSGLGQNFTKYLGGFYDNVIVNCCCSHESLHTAVAA